MLLRPSPRTRADSESLQTTQHEDHCVISTAPFSNVIRHRILGAAQLSLIAFSASLSFAYYNILLLSIPSFACFSQDLDDLRERERFARLDRTVQDAWDDFTSSLLDTWTRAARDCVWLILASSLLTNILVCGSINSYSAVATFYYICCCCCLMCIVLVWFMTRHMSGIRDRREAPRNWCASTRRNTTSSYTTTQMLLAAPIAWRNWACLTFGLNIISLLWCRSSSGDVAADAANAVLELSRNTSALAQEVESQIPTTGEGHIPISARLFIAAVALTGLWHIAFVCVHFSQLGYPLPPAPTASEVQRASRIPRRARCSCEASQRGYHADDLSMV